MKTITATTTMPTSISELIHQGHHQSRATTEVWTCYLSDTN
jgi:hypothetical protein